MIVHISRDIPDPIDRRKTSAIATLIGMLDDGYPQLTYSLNRAPSSIASLLQGPAIDAVSDGRGLVALRFEAPARGLFMRRLLERLGDWIAEDLERRRISPRLVAGHKLSIEGIVAARVADRLGCPLAITIQGNTDQKVIQARPDLRRLYRRIYRSAALVVCFAPWALRYVERALGPRPRASITEVIPCPTAADRILPPRVVGSRLVSLFRLDDHDNKNAVRLVRAARDAARQVAGLRLIIHGDGSPDAREALEKMIRAEGGGTVRLEGPLRHDAVQRTMNGAAGFVLPSKRETFGLVFTEALLAGCPILYPRAAAVDGYFDAEPFAVGADARSEEDIAAGMRRLVLDEASLKRRLEEWQQSAAACRFQRRSIAVAYRDAVGRAIGPARD